MRYHGYKFRMYPTAEQAQWINRTFGCCRVVWNLMLEDAKKNYEAKGKFLFSTPTSFKAEHPYLKLTDSMAMSSVRDHLKKALYDFCREVKTDKAVKKQFPRWKSKKKSKKSYTTRTINNNVRIQQGKLRLPKLGLVAIKFHRHAEGKIKSATISQTPTGRYFVSILMEQPDVNTARSIDPSNTVGIDMSFSEIAVYSDGARLKHPRWYRKAEKRLAQAQRRLHKRKLGSNGREKQRIRVAKIHERIANQRQDLLHKESRRLVNQYDVIVVEDINLSGMAKKGKRRRFGKSVHDMGFGMFRDLLQYKAEWAGKEFVKADRFYPSTQLCSCCGEQNTRLRGNLSIRNWTCRCGAQHDRDVNAARNLVRWHEQQNNTGASPGIYAEGDQTSTGGIATSKPDRGTRKNRRTIDSTGPSIGGRRRGNILTQHSVCRK